LRRAALLALIAVLIGCPKEEPPPDPMPGEAPLDRALLLANRSTTSLPLPAAEEAGYHVPTALPVVDALLARPTAIPAFADRLGGHLDTVTTPSEALTVLGVLAPGGSTEPGPAPELPPVTVVPSRPPPSEALGSERGEVLAGHLPPAFREPLLELVLAIEQTHEAWREFDPSGRLPRRAAEEFFVDRYGSGLRIRSHPVGVQLEFLAAARGLDQARMLAAARELAAVVERIVPQLGEAATELPPSPGYLLHLETSLGPLIVGGTGPDEHRIDAFLVVDPGGDDTWSNNAGSNVGIPSRVGIAIDLAGNDRWSAERSHVQGAGYGGMGMLVDVGGGNDDYLALSQSQGAGFLGVGVLWDDGGDDAHQADGFAQGAGAMGVGLLIDGAGNDRSAVRSRGQGFAATGGLGAYLDLDGSDQLRLGVASEPVTGPLSGGGQGGSWGTRPYPWVGDATLHGGVGLLYDRAGNDGYYARAYGQGSAEVLAVGVLLDRAGDDQYVGEWRSQGAGMHLAAGVLVDGGGNDRYEGTHTVTAAAGDRAAGLLWDRGVGNDLYSLGPTGGAIPSELGGGIAWARQAHALAVLIDEGGDDGYVARWDGLGFVVPPDRPGRDATAALLDLGGADAYAVSIERPGGNAADGATWLHEDRGVGIDTFVSRGGWDHAPVEPEGGFGPFAFDGGIQPEEPPAPAGAGDPRGDAEARWLAAEADYRASLERIVAAEPGPESAPEWLKTAALTDPDPTVRRAAARALMARGDLEGLDVLVDSLVYQTEDNWDRVTLGTIRYQLALLTGLEPALPADEWRRSWRAIRGDFDLVAAFAPVAGLELAQRRSGLRDVPGAVAACTWAIEQPRGSTVRQPCAAVVGMLGWVLGHPESHVHYDPQLALELGQLAIRWAPDQPDHFIHLARALLGVGEPDLAMRTLDKAALLDPDDPDLLALKRRIEDEQAP